MNIDVNKDAVTPQIALDCGWFMVVNQDAAKELEEEIKELTHYRKLAEALEVEVDSLEQGIKAHEKAFRAKGWDAGEEFDDKLWNLTKYI